MTSASSLGSRVPDTGAGPRIDRGASLAVAADVLARLSPDPGTEADHRRIARALSVLATGCADLAGTARPSPP